MIMLFDFRVGRVLLVVLIVFEILKCEMRFSYFRFGNCETNRCEIENVVFLAKVSRFSNFFDFIVMYVWYSFSFVLFD